MERLSTWVTRHRLMVGLLWLAITAVGLVVAPSVSGRLVGGGTVNSPAVIANEQIGKQYAGAGSNPGVIVLDLPAGTTVTSAGMPARLLAVDAALAKATPPVRTLSFAATGSQTLVGSGGRSTVVLVYPPANGADVDADAVSALTGAARAAAPDLTVHGTSLKALEDGKPARQGNSTVLSELAIGVLGALIVLAWVFGSFLALLPIIMALVSVLTMQLLVYGLSYLMPSSQPLHPAVQYIVALLGLGLSIDFSLLVVNRWREERAAGKSNDDAVRSAMVRAGHAVWFSGLTASLGLFALTVIPNSVVRGIGISGLFIPSTATLVALTLLPVVLSAAGPRLDRPRRRSSGRASRFWTAWTRQVIRHRVAAAVLGLGILAGLAGVASTITVAGPASTALAGGGPATDGLHALQADGFPGGTLTTVPVYLLDAADAPGVAAALDSVSSVRGAVTSTAPAWTRDGTALVVVIPQHEVGSSQGGTSLDDIRRTVPREAMVGGEGAVDVDQVNSTYGSFPLLFAVVALVTFVLLARGLRSILLPLKAVLLNALSVAASYGLLVLVFQHGIGMRLLWGSNTYGSIDKMAPVLIFGFLFGVSMDYEVFILSRVREAYERTGSTPGSIVEGLSRTGRLVTSAALILCLALGSLSMADDITVREIAAGLAAGVLLDAVVVRMLLLPALVSLFGAANWWMPAWTARLLRLPKSGPPPAASPARDENVLATVGEA
ncbi:MMPL family transporter [Dactylosporangium sp. CA-092794]|uniref:MMPL family transporter n=1 Tax=Dactylosporangium sp. CA-092794 TaxID=3239929 RepID=UPI003D930EF6